MLILNGDLWVDPRVGKALVIELGDRAFAELCGQAVLGPWYILNRKTRANRMP